MNQTAKRNQATGFAAGPSRRGVMKTLAASGLALPSVQSVATAASPDAMTLRITRYEVLHVQIPHREELAEAYLATNIQQGMYPPRTWNRKTLVKFHTDAGLVGVADALTGRHPYASSEQLEATLKGMIGRSPWEFLHDDAIGGLIMGMYDLVGQATGLPVARLFSSNPKPRIVQTWWSHCYPPSLMASEAKLAVSLGYRVHKVKARPWQDPIEQVAAICEVVPKDFRIWVDANAWWQSPSRALFFIDQLSKFHNYFAVESPVRYRDVEAYRALKGKSALQVSDHIGPEPMPFIREELLDAFILGVRLGKTLVQQALMAEVTRIPCWVEHSIGTGIAKVFQAHHAAAFPGIEYAIDTTHILEDDFMTEPFEMKDGFYQLPTKPGLGVTLDDDAVDRYRFA